MINRETAKQFLEVNGYPNPDSNFENELLDTMVEYAQQQVKNNDLLHSVSQRYTIEDIERCVENWGLCKVEKEYIEKFLNGG